MEVTVTLTIIILLGIIAVLIKKLYESEEENERLKNEVLNLRCIKRRREQKVF